MLRGLTWQVILKKLNEASTFKCYSHEYSNINSMISAKIKYYMIPVINSH